MTVLAGVSFFILGAIIASFVGVVVGRMHTGQSFVSGRSRCDACNTPLTFFSLVPILSFFISRGHAQCCNARISIFAPLTEILLGGLFVLVYLKLDLGYSLLSMLISLSVLLLLVLYDLLHQILPSAPLYLFVGMSTLTGLLGSGTTVFFSESLFIALSLAFVLAAIHFLSRGRAMGFADIPLVFGLALLVGKAAIPGFLFSFWIGAVVGIVLLVQRPRGSRMGVEVPFAPFLAAGFLLAYFTQWNLLTLIAVIQ